MGLFSYFFKINKKKIKSYLNSDAVIIDVRTKQEWDEIHIHNAIHIPLNQLKSNIEEIKVINKPVIIHCQSGLRSARAVKLLNFYKIDAVNGGGIADLNRLIS